MCVTNGSPGTQCTGRFDQSKRTWRRNAGCPSCCNFTSGIAPTSLVPCGLSAPGYGEGLRARLGPLADTTRPCKICRQTDLSLNHESWPEPRGRRQSGAIDLLVGKTRGSTSSAEQCPTQPR